MSTVGERGRRKTQRGADAHDILSNTMDSSELYHVE